MTEPRLGGDVYNIDYYVNKAKELEAMGADSICLKDMAGLLAPYDTYAIIKALKAAVKPPIHLHTHFSLVVQLKNPPAAKRSWWGTYNHTRHFPYNFRKKS